MPASGRKGALRDLGEAGAPWLPTSSSRSLYSETNSDMIKFSLSVRLTNSVRTLSVKEVKRGMRPARLAKTARWQGPCALPDHARDAGGRLGGAAR